MVDVGFLAAIGTSVGIQTDFKFFVHLAYVTSITVAISSMRAAMMRMVTIRELTYQQYCLSGRL